MVAAKTMPASFVPPGTEEDHEERPTVDQQLVGGGDDAGRTGETERPARGTDRRAAIHHEAPAASRGPAGTGRPHRSDPPHATATGGEVRQTR